MDEEVHTEVTVFNSNAVSNSNGAARRNALAACLTLCCLAACALLPANAGAADPVAAVKDVAVRFIQNTKTAQLKGQLDVSRNGTVLASVAFESKFDFSNKNDPRIQYTVKRIGWGSGPSTVTLYKNRVYVKVFNGIFWAPSKTIGVRRLVGQQTPEQQAATVDFGATLFVDPRDDGESTVDGQPIHLYSGLIDLDNIVELVTPSAGFMIPGRIVNTLGTDAETVRFIEQYIDHNVPRISLGVDPAGLPRVVYINAQSNNGEYTLTSRFDVTGINQPVSIKPPSIKTRRAKKMKSRGALNKAIRKGLR